MDEATQGVAQTIREQMEEVKTQIAQIEELLEDGVFNTIDSPDNT